MIRKLAFLLCGLCATLAEAQTLKLQGNVSTLQGEPLSSAKVQLYPDSVTVLSEHDGSFAITTTPGLKTIAVTFVGYEFYQETLQLKRDTTCLIRLYEKLNELNVVTVVDKRDPQQEILESNQASVHILEKEDITGIPVLGGEADVIKTLQLLPGTIRGVEGSSDLFIRGGAADQNLVLLDGAPIYNTSHLFGFLSVFNPDVVDHVEAINGGFPARYGGRLSSILNVATERALPHGTFVSGDIGLIASRLFIEQPIVKDKLSFWVAGRRTYIDQVVKALGDDELPYFFYDLNGKILFKPNSRNSFELAHYSGEDILDLFRDRNNDGNGFLTTYKSGNDSQSLSWKRTYNNRWSSDMSLIRSRYKYSIRNIFEDNQLLALSDIEDFGARVLFRKGLDSLAHFETGVEWTRHGISPNVVNTAGIIAELLESSSSSGRAAHEVAVHGAYEWPLTPRLRVNAGVRVSAAITGNKTYFFPEPRFSMRYNLGEHQAIKLSYSRMIQYIHRISNSAVTSPTDVWYPVTDSIRPQTSHQVAVAWQRSLPSRQVFLSVEAYYKSMHQLIGYEEGTNLFFNTDFESRLIQGRGNAYGVEVLLRKDAGKFTGWISYTLSWSWRQFDAVNAGKWFPSRYDRRHNGAIVAQYAFNKRLSLSMVWEFISGSRFTPVVGQYVIFAPTLTGVDMIPVYSGINQVKLADTHRLDAGLKFRSKPGKRFQWHWFAGVYNAYNRANPIGITIEQAPDGSLQYEQPGLFGLLPFISYGFKF